MNEFLSENIYHLRYFGWVIIYLLIFTTINYFASRKEPIKQKTITIDLFYLIFNYTLANFVTTLGMLSYPYIKEFFTSFTWLAELPFTIQIIISLLLIDFNGYWVHRFMHSTKLTWSLHAIHHSSPQMYWLAAERSHPINSALGAFLTLGFLSPYIETQPLVISGIISLGYAYFIHSGLNIHYHLFNKVLVSPLYHEQHHSQNKLNYNTNFAGMFSFLDVIFKTYYFDKGKKSIKVGVQNLNESFSDQLLYPFIKK